MKQFAGMLLALLCIATCPGCQAPRDSSVVNRYEGTTVPNPGHVTEPAPVVAVTLTPSQVKIDDTAKQGTHLATVTVRRSNGAPYTGKVVLTNNPGGICQLVGSDVQLGRDTTKADDYTTLVCTVTAAE